MFKIILAMALAAFALPATAGNLDTVWDDPDIIGEQYECLHFGFIPCHETFEYVEPENSDPNLPQPKTKVTVHVDYLPTKEQREEYEAEKKCSK